MASLSLAGQAYACSREGVNEVSKREAAETDKALRLTSALLGQGHLDPADDIGDQVVQDRDEDVDQ